ncbi:hypothetical protein MLD38_010417 [Melastoma candidum]|uniref:Uncharacterized protein n=1 Tax=Melastoma candidum TaxID=119954 RepID=A0ACB9QZU3_9MYRT|nr:hypothetical protein MLD38_010417 [Melastoma candidum]
MRTLPTLSMTPAESPLLSSISPSPTAHGCLSANDITIIIILLCALICSLTLHASVRLFLRSSPVSRRLLPPQTEVVSASVTDQLPSHERRIKPSESELVAYRSFGVLEARAGAECCAICLAEFEDGEKVRVLAKCEHEFHSDCVERWWLSSASCPTCRRACAVEDKAEKEGLEQGIGE